MVEQFERRRKFSPTSLVIGIVVLATFAGVAIPIYQNLSASAKHAEVSGYL